LKPRKSKSLRGNLLKQCDTLIRKILLHERGDTCQLCGKRQKDLHFALSLFHILEKGIYPGIRYHRDNLLLACWSPKKYYYMPYCHNLWHHNKDRIKPKVIELCGENYEERLKILDKKGMRTNSFNLMLLKVALQQELKKLEDRGENDK